MLSPQQVKCTELADERIQRVLIRAPGNDAPIGGLKVIAERGWFAVRPSGTEDIDKIYVERFHDNAHLRRITKEAQASVEDALADCKRRPPARSVRGTGRRLVCNRQGNHHQAVNRTQTGHLLDRSMRLAILSQSDTVVG